jgi:hypothetical protein
MCVLGAIHRTTRVGFTWCRKSNAETNAAFVPAVNSA